MKVKGQTVERKAAIFPDPDRPLTFKRGKMRLAFLAQPVWDFDEFEELVPMPVNKKMRFNKDAPGGKEPDPNNPAHKDAMRLYGRKRWGYTILKTLEPSPDLEWETCSLADPTTWDKAEAELAETLANYEFAKVMKLIDEANALDDEKLEANAEDFFRARLAEEADENENSPLDGPPNSAS